MFVSCTVASELGFCLWKCVCVCVCVYVQKLLSCVKATCLSKPHLERTEVTHPMWKRFKEKYDNI